MPAKVQKEIYLVVPILVLVVLTRTGSGTRIGTKTLALNFHAIAIIHRAAVSFLACAMFARSKFLACMRNTFCLALFRINAKAVCELPAT